MKTHTTSYAGTRIGDILKSRGLRQDWVAAQSGISPAHLCRIINGERGASSAVAERIAGTLQLPFFLVFELPEGSDMRPDEMEEAA